jgi:hypothetical protein
MGQNFRDSLWREPESAEYRNGWSHISSRCQRLAACFQRSNRLSGLRLATGRTPKHNPGCEVFGELLEAMFDTGGDKEYVARLK